MSDEALPFSKRFGYRPATRDLQIDYIEDDLRTALWNSLFKHYLSGLVHLSTFKPYKIEALCQLLWSDSMKQGLDEMPVAYRFVEIFKQFFFDVEWYDVYEVIETVVKNYANDEINTQFRNECNKILEREFAGYRLVGNQFLKNTSPQEIAEIEKAVHSSLEPVNSHLNQALKLLSDKKEPDYRNSIKESISAVEALCQAITGTKLTLGKTLAILR